MSFKIGDKVTYYGNNKHLKTLFCKEFGNQEINVGEVVDVLNHNYFGGPIVKVKFENGYLAGNEEDFRLYKEPKVEKETENPYQYVFEATQRIENKATVLFSGKEKGGISFTVDFKEGFGETSEEKFLWAILAAVEKMSPDLIFKFMTSNIDIDNEECECCEDECNCDEDCNCECENCKCSLKPYSGKIYCVKSGYDYITEGKIYEVKEGKIEADDGWIIKVSPEKGVGVLSTFEEFAEVLRGEWLEVKEAEEIISPSNYEADIICIYSGPIENFTKGKIYRVENGYLYDDKKNKISWYGVPFTDINGINSYCASIFKEIKH